MKDIKEIYKSRMGPLGEHSHYAHGEYAYPKLEGEIHPYMYFKGKKVLNWSINNYLGLANHPEVRETDEYATKKYGLAYPMGSRMMSGNTVFHEALEDELASFVKKPNGLLLNYGYQGMVSLIESLLNRRDVAVYDSECHACIIDGLRLHLGKRFVFSHNNIESFEKQIAKAKKLAEENGGCVWVITEGVFGMSGNQGKLREICGLKHKYGFNILLDDAHGFGVMGKNGEGTHVEQDVQDKIDVYFSTFAKSMAGIGAFVASEKEIIKYLQYNLRSQIYAKSLPLAMVIGVQKRLQLLKEKPELRQKLWKITHALQDGLKSKGFNIGSTNAPVTPVILSGSVFEAVLLIKDLRSNYGLFCSIVIHPVVPKGVVILRLIPTSSHTLDDVEKTIKTFCEIKLKLENKEYLAEAEATTF